MFQNVRAISQFYSRYQDEGCAALLSSEANHPDIFHVF